MKFNKDSFLLWGAQIVSAVILLQTLAYKFTAHPDSVALFSTLGAEPYGRIILGVVELLVGIMLFIPSVAVFAALLGIGIMAGAIVAHIVLLGINALFLTAVFVLLCLVYVVYRRRKELQELF